MAITRTTVTEPQAINSVYNKVCIDMQTSPPAGLEDSQESGRTLSGQLGKFERIIVPEGWRKASFKNVRRGTLHPRNFGPGAGFRAPSGRSLFLWRSLRESREIHEFPATGRSTRGCASRGRPKTERGSMLHNGSRQ